MSNWKNNFCNKSPFKQKAEYRNLVETDEPGKFNLSGPVDKKDWNRKSGQKQRYKKGKFDVEGNPIPKSTVSRTKYGTEREHEWGRIRYDKPADKRNSLAGFSFI